MKTSKRNFARFKQNIGVDMKTKCHLALFASVFAVSVWAQSSPQPLNLKLPSESAAVAAAGEPSESSTAGLAAAPDASTQPSPNPMPSAMYYDDANPRNRVAGAPACDDSTYNELQVHGSVGAGVVGGNHISGNYQDAVINVSKHTPVHGDPPESG